MNKILLLLITIVFSAAVYTSSAQSQQVRLIHDKSAKQIDVMIENKLFTSFLYSDTLYKPVLYPIYAANGTMITRGYPIHPKPGEPTDHPHHLGLWFNYESVNGLDFWNNSFAIPAERKSRYGWIKTDAITEVKGNSLTYHANWTNQANETLLEELTTISFRRESSNAISITRTTELKAATEVALADVKDGMLGLRLAQELQIPEGKEKKFTDDKGNVTVVKANADNVSNGNYLTSAGKQGNDAWGTRASWCKVYARMGKDSVSITIFDHPQNPNYPTFWHARGYGLFAANPLGEKAFTNGKSALNMKLQKGESVKFTYRVLVQNGSKTLSAAELEQYAQRFGKE